MSRNPLSVRLVSSILMAGALVFTGCNDNDYDFDQIDATVGIGGDGLEIPVSTTEDIMLKDVLDLEEDGSVVEDPVSHDYVFRRTGDPIDPINVEIDRISVAKRGGQSIPFTFNVVSSSSRGKRAAGAKVAADADIYEFHYHGTKPEDVRELLAADAQTRLSLTVPLTKIQGVVKELQVMKITLPSYLKIRMAGSSATPKSVEGTAITFENVQTSKDFSLNVDVTGIDFTVTPVSGSISINNNDIDLEGRVHITASGAVTGTATSSPTLMANFSMEDFVITSAYGKFDPDIKFDEKGLGRAEITGIPEFLQDDNVKVDLYNPQILLTVDNEMGADGTIYGTLVSKKKGKQDVVISNIAIPIVGNTVNNICINRTGEAREGYVVVKEPRLSEAIERVPDEVLFDATAKANSEKVVKFDLGRNYKVKPSYRIEAPLAFAENAEIVYKDTLDEWNDDLQDYELAENTYLSATANVANGVPVFLSVDVVPVDVDKKEVKGVKVELLKKDIAASANGTDKVVSPLEMKITQTEKGALKKLDGLILTATGKAKEGDKTVTGITLNAEKHTLKITDIRIKIVGKVIGDFN